MAEKPPWLSDDDWAEFKRVHKLDDGPAPDGAPGGFNEKVVQFDQSRKRKAKPRAGAAQPESDAEAEAVEPKTRPEPKGVKKRGILFVHGIGTQKPGLIEYRPVELRVSQCSPV